MNLVGDCPFILRTRLIMFTLYPVFTQPLQSPTLIPSTHTFLALGPSTPTPSNFHLFHPGPFKWSWRCRQGSVQICVLLVQLCACLGPAILGVSVGSVSLCACTERVPV